MTICAICCGTIADAARLTCGQTCHEVLVARLERTFGKTKRVTSAKTGKTYLVPTRYIIERGMRADELANFPEETD